ncbi:MAG: hypothetical protein KCHDKBKB_02201 [Elusimicrobia bacterium]|nr:hypothetical protein [Elusimicrobiota bacterium]
MEILGQPFVLHYLNEGLRQGRLSPSLFFVGPDGVGKRLCAIELAKCFACEELADRKIARATKKINEWVNNESLPRCGNCQACRKISENNHADVLLINRDLQATILKEKLGSQTAIKIDSIRYLNKFLSLKPIESQRRVVIVDEAHLMNTEAANALLKILEEPPQQAQLILLANNEQALPSTVRSRCAIVRFRSIPVKIMSDWLEREHAVSESKAIELADRSGGSFEKALAFKDEDRPSTDLSDYTLDEFFTLLASTNWKKEGRKRAETAVTQLIESSQKKLEEGDLNQRVRLQTLLDARKHLDNNVPAKLVLENLYIKLEGVR